MTVLFIVLALLVLGALLYAFGPRAPRRVRRDVVDRPMRRRRVVEEDAPVRRVVEEDGPVRRYARE